MFEFVKAHWEGFGGFIVGCLITGMFAAISWGKLALVGGIGIVALVAFFALKGRYWERYDDK